jgi:putative transposase
LARRAYNCAIEHFKNTPVTEQLNVVDLRKKIWERVKAEWKDKNYRAEVAGEAVRDAFRTRSAIISKRKKGVKCDYKFRSIKEVRQSFVEQRLTKKFMGNFFVTEEIGEESFGRTTDIVFKSGRWFVCALVHTEIFSSAGNQGLRICSVDPGVRTFATAFDGQESVKYGEGFYNQKVFPLLPDLDNLISERQIFLDSKPDKETQAFSDKMRFFAKRIDKLRNRIEDLTDDLHRRVAYDLVIKNDVIVLPTFETKDMASKQDRKISSKTVRSMLGLAHYKFKQTMRWMCLKYGKTLIDVNEAYTSKTMSWCGKIKENLGGSKTISDGIIKVDRDINAARNILLKSIAVA